LVSLSNLLVPAILFFGLGLIAQFIKSDLKFPPDFTKALTIYLLLGIGIHGGMELSKVEISSAIPSIAVALALGFTLPIIAYAILSKIGRIDPLNSAAIAAHYGSVSAGTFLSAVAFLDAIGEPYEAYPVIMLAIMESPAIIIGLILASFARKSAASSDDSARSKPGNYGALLREAFTNGSIVLLFGGMLVGMVSTDKSLTKILPFFDSLFMGGLCIFLLNMGMEAAKRMNEFKSVGKFLVAFGLLMPVLGAIIGLITGHYVLGFGVGGTTLVAVLGASASYIAVPPAMRLAIPEANPSLYLTLSLGITFPLNVVFGIPIYYQIAKSLA
jgi:uncharacterized protein